MVAPFEEHDARIAARYTLGEWNALGWEDRALEVAHYRLRRLVALHSQDAQATAQERAARAAQRR